jgi:hypothetical protein
MTCRREFAPSICLLVLTLSLHGLACAQGNYDEVGRRQIAESCERAKHALPQAATKGEKIRNIVALQECDEEGVQLLRNYWRTAADDDQVVGTLASVSVRLNDRRLYEAARSVLLDNARSESTRLSALTVLVAGFDPSLAVAFPAPTVPMQSTYVALGHTSHRPSRKAPQPVGHEARTDLLTVLDGLASTEPNERIRKVAQELGPLLRRRGS